MLAWVSPMHYTRPATTTMLLPLEAASIDGKSARGCGGHSKGRATGASVV